MVQINEISGLFAAFGGMGRSAVPQEPPAPGMYRIDLRRSAALHVLTPAHPAEGAPKFAYVMAALEAPRRDDAYIVQLPDEYDERGICDVRVIAYVDRFARVFSQDAPSSIPPARRPDLMFESYDRQARYGGPEGDVVVFDESGNRVIAAKYRREGRFTSLHDSLYDFGFASSNITLDEALARAYLAFVYMPRKEGRSLKVFNLESVHDLLESKPLVTALREIRHQVEDGTGKRKQGAGGFGGFGGAGVAGAAGGGAAGGMLAYMKKPPVLAQCLARWLSEAGLSQVLAMTAHSQDVQLRLVNGTAYSTTYFVAREEGCVVPERLIWKLEGALNRFRILEEQFGPMAEVASEVACSKRDLCNIRDIGLQAPLADQPINSAEALREWDVRRSIGEAIERFRLPLRFECGYRVDVAGQTAAFEMIVPSPDMMPEFAFDEDESRWRLVSYEHRTKMAEGYAMQLGILVAAAAFRASCRIQEVAVCARPFQTVGEDRSDLLGMILSQGADSSSDRFACCYTVKFDRAAFCKAAAYLRAAQGDPFPFFEGFGANFEKSQPTDVFDYVEGLASDAVRRELTGGVDRPMSPESQKQLNAVSTRDLCINYDAELRLEGEKLADRLANAASAADVAGSAGGAGLNDGAGSSGGASLSESIRLVREVQNESNDVSVLSACTRLMTALVEGRVNADDKNGVVDCFLGEDPYVTALDRANALEDQKKNDEAVRVLVKEVDEAIRAGVFSDDGLVVHRVFDTSISRVLYNALRTGALNIEGIDLSAEKDMRVELASDGLYYCALDASRLMEGTFGGIEEALRYGELCMKMAPTMVQGYLQTARLYMMMGDAEAARSLLLRALRLVVQEPVVSTVYYQLGYVEWKSGHLNAAMACYLKAIASSPQVRLQAIGELRMLIAEEHVELLDRSRIEEALTEQGIPLAPCGDVADVLLKAAEGAVNENLFPTAGPLLAAALTMRPDDVRGRILDSLG